MPLNVKQIEKLKPQDKQYRVADSKGLCLEPSPTGNKRWRFRYRFNGKAKMLSLGVWPDVNLANARDKRNAMRELSADGIDLAVQTKAQADFQKGEGTFEAVAREYFDKFKSKWTDTTANRKMRRLETHAFPLIGDLPFGEVDAPQVRRNLGIQTM